MQKPKNISWYWLLFAREQHLEAHLHGARLSYAWLSSIQFNKKIEFD